MLIPTHTHTYTVLHKSVHMGYVFLVNLPICCQPVERHSPSSFPSSFIPKDDTILELTAHSVI